MAGSAGNAEYGNYHVKNGRLRMRIAVQSVIIAMTALTSVAHGQSRIALRRKRVYCANHTEAGCFRNAASSARGIATIDDIPSQVQATKRCFESTWWTSATNETGHFTPGPTPSRSNNACPVTPPNA